MASGEPYRSKLERHGRMPVLPPDDQSFYFIVTMKQSTAEDQVTLLDLLANHKPRALANGASYFAVTKSVEGHDICIVEFYEEPGALKKFRAVHEHPEFENDHFIIKDVQNKEGNSASAGFFLPVA